MGIGPHLFVRMLGLSDGFERKSGVNPHHMNKIYPENAFYICYIFSNALRTALIIWHQTL